MSNWREQLGPILERAKALALPLIGGFFLIIYAGMGFAYFQERQTQAELIGEIEILDRLLQIAALQEPLEDVQARAEAAASAVPVSILPDQYVFPAMRRLAAEWGVAIQTQKSSKLRRATFGENTFEAYPFDLTVAGTYVEVMNFVRVLEFQEDIPTLIVQKVSIDARVSGGVAAITYEVVSRTKS